MSTVAAKTKITPDDLLAMPDQKNYELVGGELVEKNVSALSSWVGLEVGYRAQILPRRESDRTRSSAPTMVTSASPTTRARSARPTSRSSSTSGFPATGRRPAISASPPDLAVEVVSPNDLYYEVEEKVQEYLNAGVSLVWVIDPEVRVVRVHRADSTAAYLTENDELSGEDVLPGFRCRVRSLFPPPVAVAPEVK